MDWVEEVEEFEDWDSTDQSSIACGDDNIDDSEDGSQNDEAEWKETRGKARVQQLDPQKAMVSKGSK